MIKLFTIGFTNKSAEKFFNLLGANKISKVVDTRINNSSQLAGFSKGKDLAFFVGKILNAEYEHRTDFAPTRELLDAYRKGKMSWDEYEKEYENLLKSRKIEEKISVADLNNICLLCSEDTPEKCHRRILAEYLRGFYPEIEIVHLV